MSLLNSWASEAIETTTGKSKTLNPHAAEFVPFALRNTSSGADTCSSFGKSILDRTESCVSNNSEDEAHQFWRHQLPDDITPDFNLVGEEESQEGILKFSSLSISDVNGNSTFLSTGGGDGGGMFMPTNEQQHELSPLQINGRRSFTNFQQMSPAKPWDINIIDGSSYSGDPGQGYLDDMLNQQQVERGTDVNSLEFLASQFPGFAAESLAEVYYANGCDLNLTVEMLTQLEVDNDVNHNMNSKALSAPNLSALDFPALSPTDNQNNVSVFSGHDNQQNVNSYRSLEKELLMFKSSSSTAPSLGSSDFASAVRKMSPQDSSIWKYDKNNSPNSTIGSSRSSHNIAGGGFGGGHGRSGIGDRLANRSSTRSAPVWLETGEAVANMYSEMRGEARDHARLRNAYFEQARQAYLVGHKALAKELSVKGQLHNMQMKAAHEKAQESIYYQRNPISVDMQQGNGRGQERIIDLHGLHVSEAIHVLKRDLMTLKNIARSAEQRLQVYICVGTGHHTKGTRTPARLPVAVQRYLLEEEGLHYSEPQPGLLRVVVY